MANVGAFQAGWQDATQLVDEARIRTQQRADEEHKLKIDDLIGQRSALVSKINDLKDTPDYEKNPQYQEAFNALKTVNEGLVDIYHPQKNPGAIERFWPHLLTDHLKITSSDARKAKQDQLAATKDKNAVAKTEEDIAGAPLSPTQASLAEVRAKVAAIDKSDLSDEDKAEAKRKLFGVSEKPSLKLYASPDGSTKAWLDANRADSIPVGWTAYTAPSAVGTELTQYNDAVKNGYKGTLLQWKKEQSAGTEPKYIAATGQVVDPQTHKTYSEGDPNAPPEVAAVFKSVNALTAKKQAFQMKLASVRGAQYNLTKPLNVLDTANGNAHLLMQPMATSSKIRVVICRSEKRIRRWPKRT